MKKNQDCSEAKQKPMYSLWENFVFWGKDMWTDKRSMPLLMLLQVLLTVGLSAFAIVLPQIMLTLLERRASPKDFVAVIGGMALLGGAAAVASGMVQNHVKMYRNCNRIKYMEQYYNKGIICDYQLLETPDFQIKLQKARDSLLNDYCGITYLGSLIPELAADILSVVLFGSIISSLTPVILVLLLVSAAIDGFVLNYLWKYEFRHKDTWAELDRKFNYLARKGQDYSAAKDIRLYHIQNWFSSLFDNLLKARLKWMERHMKQEYKADMEDALTFLLRDGVTYLMLVVMVVRGEIGVPEFVFFTGAVSGMAGWMSMIINRFHALRKASLQVSEMRECLDTPDQPRTETAHLPLSGAPFSIRFEHVSFRYSGDDKDILHDLDFEIAAGERVALVGANGAGKTTCVKLLCGFYMPTSGRILIGGRDTRDLPKEEQFDLFSTVFQDLTILPFSAGQNIAPLDYIENGKKDGSDSSLEASRLKVRQALEMADLSQRIPDLDIPMTRDIEENGTDLSGGEAQRLALARALYKNAPILVLDEPTAALDPIAEHEQYLKYNQYTHGKTAVFISHRLASTRFCDRICFLKDGQITESGTHEELLSQGREYARMFEIQSHYYQEKTPAPGMSVPLGEGGAS